MNLAAMTGESLESETTTLGSKSGMLFASKATCLRKLLNMSGKCGRNSFDEKLPFSVHSTSRGGLERTSSRLACEPRYSRACAEQEKRKTSPLARRRDDISRTRVACPKPEPKTEK